jgi:hypothetical protein
MNTSALELGLSIAFLFSLSGRCAATHSCVFPATLKAASLIPSVMVVLLRVIRDSLCSSQPSSRMRSEGDGLAYKVAVTNSSERGPAICERST